MMWKKFASLLLVVTVLIAGQAWAQPGAEETLDAITNSPIPVRDPVDLAVRLQGLDPATLNFAPRPAYEVGDRERFNIGGMEGSEASQREFTLAAVSPSFYLWVEQGFQFDPAKAERIVQEAESMVLPRLREVFGNEPALTSDERIYILTVGSAGPGIAGVFFDTDLYPNEVFPSSNEINSVVMVQSLSYVEDYLSTLAHELQHLVQINQDDSEETWVVEGMAELGSFLAAPDYFDTGFQQGYIDQGTDNALNFWPESNGETVLYYGGASLFLSYVVQRYGEEAATLMAQAPANGVIGINAALENLGTGVDFADVFGDFVIANYLNDPTLAEGRFAHTLLNVTNTASADLSFVGLPVDLTGSQVNQYGTQYIELNLDEASEVQFTGQSSVAILPTQAYSGEYFYWSQTGNQGDSRLTGRFDLRNLDKATLVFHTWYDMEEFWDYGYLSVSGDNGATWQVIQTPQMSSNNPYERAFTAGYTGASIDSTARPAPYLGIEMSSDLTVTKVNPDTPAAAAGLQVGDQLAAVNDERLVAGFYNDIIDQYQPGETVELAVLRAGQALSLPITLGESPFRTITGGNNWIQQTVDLTPLVGGEVLIRFDYVTDQAVTLPGWALDDVIIAELNYLDSFEQADPAWQAEGWVRITNRVPQAYLVQVISFGEETTVTRLLEPGNGQSGTWTLEPGRHVLAISALAPITTLPAPYDLVITPAE